MIKVGVQSAFFYIFLGENAAGSLTLDNSLVSALHQYPVANNLMFGWKVTNKPEPCHLKKVVLMLAAAKILGFCIHCANENEENNIRLYWHGSLQVHIGLVSPFTQTSTGQSVDCDKGIGNSINLNYRLSQLVSFFTIVGSRCRVDSCQFNFKVASRIIPKVSEIVV
jgi:hypothetical protein